MEPITIYEDNNLVVLNKPAGLIMHSDGRTVEPSVAHWLLSRYPGSENVGEPWTSPQGEVIARPGIVHRLDRGTSGVIVVAKNQEAYLFLKEQFQARTANKKYRALVYGHPAKEGGVIEAEITRIRSIPPRWGVVRKDEEKKQRTAITEWSVLSRAIDAESREKISYLEARPKTGRTHQIRVHFKHLNHPVVCDPLYAKGRPCILGFKRPALHALSLTLIMPSGEEKTFEAPLPEDFKQALSRLKIIV